MIGFSLTPFLVPQTGSEVRHPVTTPKPTTAAAAAAVATTVAAAAAAAAISVTVGVAIRKLLVMENSGHRCMKH